MKYNKGITSQVIIYIIVGILVVIGVVFYILNKNIGNNNPTTNINVEIPNPSNNKVASSIKETPSNNVVINEGCEPGSLPTITVISPNGDESFKAGSKITAKWQSCNFEKNPVYITLLKQNPSIKYSQNADSITLIFILVDSGKGTANDGNEEITLPKLDNNLTAGTNYFIAVSGDSDINKATSVNNPKGFSDKLFTIN